MLMNKDQVLNFLPHRDPFMFLDSVEEVDLPENLKEQSELEPRDLVGTKVVAHFTIQDSMEILKGHFPGNPIVPGVVQVEMMAQASAFVSLPLNNGKLDGINVETLLLGVEKARFRKPIAPGMKLEVRSLMTKCRGQVASYDCEVFCDGEKVSEASILAKLTVIKN